MRYGLYIGPIALREKLLCIKQRVYQQWCEGLWRGYIEGSGVQSPAQGPEVKWGWTLVREDGSAPST